MNSYDDRQRLAPRLRCACGAEFYVTKPRENFVCVDCQEKNETDQARVVGFPVSAALGSTAPTD